MYKKTKALDRIQTSMEEIDPGSFRYEILKCAKNFKSSWLELGQHLMAVYKDKMYKEWDYLTFEAYCSKEIGIRKETGLKLLRSYYFLEQEEPQFIKKDYLESANSPQLPSYEAVNTLRQVKTNKDLSIADYEKMKHHVFEEGKADKDVKDVYKAMIKSVRPEVVPEETHRQRRITYLRRMLGVLNSIKKEIRINNFLSDDIISEIENVIGKVEAELL
ncbi:MAG: hypothetical protein V1739_04900 [Candidatus Omnitrophota bacterium]